ncbi:hypothetical protein Metfor_1365 [Methanoregula formicica SMSP]|uniref:Uncharacterized protein n=1 Tax=Methanoregula formicica (strain DSM 22288 / NBRC 105244 / SMSP) TaxID=593750 RepID=L0HH51_METFS|nr:hypothetical protein Metfor_1365 [Methanoregula formicica SMSP]
MGCCSLNNILIPPTFFYSTINQSFMSKREDPKSILEESELSQEDRDLGSRLQAGENVEWEIRAKDPHNRRYSIDPWPLVDLSENPDCYQKMMNDIDAAIKKNILEWSQNKPSTQPRTRSRKVVLGGNPYKQCSSCLSLNFVYVKFCQNCGAHFK